MNKLKCVEEWLLDEIKELEGYIDSDEYDDIEKHDCHTKIDAYTDVLALIHSLKR